MANIGEQLLQPGPGMKRIEDTNPLISYSDNVLIAHNSAHSNGTIHYTNYPNKGSAKIHFYSTSIMLVSQIGTQYRGTNEKVILDGEEFLINTANMYDGSQHQSLVFEKTGLSNSQHTLELIGSSDGAYPFMLDAVDIDEDGYLLTEEEYEAIINKCIIKSNDKYYTIEENVFIEITEEITQDLISNRGISVVTLTSNQSLLPDKFKLIFQKDNTVNINSIKSNKELIVASNNFLTKIADHIDFFKIIYQKDSNSNVKIAFSTDNGSTWKGRDFNDLSIEIPLKSYSELTEEEKIKWDTAKEVIATNGIGIEDLESLDFNTLDFEYIRFAYVLSITGVDDVCNTTKLQWQFDAKGSMQLMDSTEVSIEVLSNSIKVTPKTEEELIKVNITNGTCSGLENPSQDEKMTTEEIKAFVTEILS